MTGLTLAADGSDSDKLSSRLKSLLSKDAEAAVASLGEGEEEWESDDENEGEEDDNNGGALTELGQEFARIHIWKDDQEDE